VAEDDAKLAEAVERLEWIASSQTEQGYKLGVVVELGCLRILLDSWRQQAEQIFALNSLRSRDGEVFERLKAELREVQMTSDELLVAYKAELVATQASLNAEAANHGKALAELAAANERAERLELDAKHVVAEYESHGGRGTHQECTDGRCCLLPSAINMLRMALRSHSKAE
jgi:hypothetical protein